MESLELCKVGKGSVDYLLSLHVRRLHWRDIGELEPEGEKKSKNRCEVLNSETLP